MSDAYETVTDSILSSLITVVKTAASFSEHTYADFVKKVPAFPTAFIRLKRDSFRAIGPMETRHILTFTIQINHRGGYDKDTLDEIISYTGEIVDAIEADRSLSSAMVENTEVVDVDYTFRLTDSAVFHYSNITVEVENIRNV